MPDCAVRETPIRRDQYDESQKEALLVMDAGKCSHVVYVISDATGVTGQRVVQAALAQFSGAEVQVELRPGVREEEQLRTLVREAATAGGTIVHTLAVPELKMK